MKWSDAELDALVTKPAIKMELRGTDFAAQSQVLAHSLRSIFLSDPQVRAILRHLVSLARGHAEAHFDTDEKYLKGLYSKTIWGTGTSPAICLTGLAGVGKSEILAALGRLLDTKRTFSVPGHADLPLEAVWSLTLAHGAGPNQILKEFVLPNGRPVSTMNAEDLFGKESKQKDMKIPALMDLVRRLSWRGAMCLATIDEFQRITTSIGANAKATSVLIQLLNIGPLLTYCPNYSLVHKLKRRNHEDRQRLLSCPIIVHPPAAESDDWIAYLAAVKSVAPEVFAFEPKDDAEQIHFYTAGLKRLVVELVVIAFRLAKTRSPHGLVGSRELLAAYQSLQYSTNREDVEILQKQEITRVMIREDLWCPFDSNEEVSKVTTLTAAITSFESRTEDALLEAAMLPGEAAARTALTSHMPSVRFPAKVLRFRQGKASKDDLLAGAAVLAKLD